MILLLQQINKQQMKERTNKMIKSLVLALALTATANTPVVTPATVIETYDNVMVVETIDGNEWEYEFDGMSNAEKYAKTVVIINDRVVVIK